MARRRRRAARVARAAASRRAPRATARCAFCAYGRRSLSGPSGVPAGTRRGFGRDRLERARSASSRTDRSRSAEPGRRVVLSPASAPHVTATRARALARRPPLQATRRVAALASANSIGRRRGGAAEAAFFSASPRDSTTTPHLSEALRPSRTALRIGEPTRDAAARARAARDSSGHLRALRQARARVRRRMHLELLAHRAPRPSSRRRRPAPAVRARRAGERAASPRGGRRGRARACARRCVDACPPRPPGPAASALGASARRRARRRERGAGGGGRRACAYSTRAVAAADGLGERSSA